MKLGVATILAVIAVFEIDALLSACATEKPVLRYGEDLQGCIVRAKTDPDAATYQARLDEYNRCADALLDGGLR